MQFIVRSKGRTIGVTDLGFVCTDVHHRMGWFYPNEYAKRVMPHISALLPALRASLGKYDGVSFTLPPEILNAEDPCEEAYRRFDALELTLHREDGTLIRTKDIGIKDVEQLLAFADEALAEFDEEDDDWQSYDSLVDEDDPLDLETDPDAILFTPRFDPIEPWQPPEQADGDDDTEWPQFQIYVEVATPLDDNPVIADDEWWRKHDRW